MSKQSKGSKEPIIIDIETTIPLEEIKAKASGKNAAAELIETQIASMRDGFDAKCMEMGYRVYPQEYDSMSMAEQICRDILDNPMPQPSIIDGDALDSTKAAAPKEANFNHLILMDEPDVLMNALRRFIEADGRKPSEIGAMFFRCRLLKYISGNPTEAEAKSAFKISANWSGVQNYMPKDVHARNYDAAFNLADRLKLLPDEPELPY